MGFQSSACSQSEGWVFRLFRWRLETLSTRRSPLTSCGVCRSCRRISPTVEELHLLFLQPFCFPSKPYVGCSSSCSFNTNIIISLLKSDQPVQYKISFTARLNWEKDVKMFAVYCTTFRIYSILYMTNRSKKIFTQLFKALLSTAGNRLKSTQLNPPPLPRLKLLFL